MKSKKKTKSEEPVFNLEQSLKKDSNQCKNTTEDRVPPLPLTASVVLDKCVTPDNNAGRVKTPNTIVRKSVEEESQAAVNTGRASYKRPQSNTPTLHKSCKTPIRHFDLMNVKEKVHAYEEIVLISPLTNTKNIQATQNTNNNSATKHTPKQSPVTPKTPVTITRKSASPKTPEQSVDAKVPNETGMSQNKDRLNATQTLESPVTGARKSSLRSKSSAKKIRNSRSSVRASLKRVSLKHGKILPSEEKRLEVIINVAVELQEKTGLSVHLDHSVGPELQIRGGNEDKS